MQRKKALLQDEGEKKASASKAAEEKLKSLRKEHSDLVVVKRELDERVKSLKTENDQLVSGCGNKYSQLSRNNTPKVHCNRDSLYKQACFIAYILLSPL